MRETQVGLKFRLPILITQAVSFLFVSGIGWALDFSVFFCLTRFLGFPILAANCTSAAPAVLWVFWFSSKRIFMANKSKFSLRQKYFLYFGYQLLLVAGISFLADYLHAWLLASGLISFQPLLEYSKLLVKIAITPVTMLMNFITMKTLVEKL